MLLLGPVRVSVVPACRQLVGYPPKSKKISQIWLSSGLAPPVPTSAPPVLHHDFGRELTSEAGEPNRP